MIMRRAVLVAVCGLMSSCGLMVASIAVADEGFKIDGDRIMDGYKASPYVFHLYEDTYRIIHEEVLPTSLYLLISKTSPDYDPLREQFIAAAKQFQGKTRYVIVDMDDAWNREYVFSTFGHKEQPTPNIYATMFSVDGERRRYFPDFTEMSTENIAAYNERLLAGNITKRIFRSEEIPDDWNALPVKVLVSKNFHEVISNSGKSALVFFYSPYSPYSTQLYEIWEEIGDIFQHSEKILVAKVDTVHGRNEIEGVENPSLPSIMYFPAGSKEIIKHKGERTLDGIVDFVKEQLKKGEKKKLNDEI